MKVSVINSYSISSESIVDLPIDDWSVVDRFFVKWGQLHYLLKGQEEWDVIDLNEYIDMESMDTKRPAASEVYGVDEDGYTQYGYPLTDENSG